MPPQLLHGNLIRHRPHLQMVSRYRHHLPQETPTQSRPLIIPWRSSIQAASEGLHGHRKLLILFFVTFTPPRQSLYKEGLHARQHVEDPINPHNARLNGQHSLSSPTIPRSSGISMEWLDPEYVNPVCQQHHAQVRLYRMRIRQWRWNVDSDLTATNKSSPLSHHRVASQASARFMIGRT